MATGAVSRYKITTEPGICHVTGTFFGGTGAESGYTLIRVMTEKAEGAKTVTSFWTLLSVLEVSCAVQGPGKENK